MTDEPFNAAEVGLRIARALEARQLPYALGGALAFGVWALPRATRDVDVNLFLEPAALDPAFEALEEAGVKLERERARQEAEQTGLFIGWVGSCRVDVFTPSIPFSWEALKTRVHLDAAPASAWFLSAEALAFFKLMFFRGKDIVDLERLLGTMGTKLDAPYVRRWLAVTMGEDDERVKKWDELVRTFWRDPPA